MELDVSERPELAQRFLAEARITANLNHPNILTIHEVGDDDGRHYIATEYGVADLYGRSIRERVKLLIDIAHPDFRAELADAAEQYYRVARVAVPDLLDRQIDKQKVVEFGD